jgi:YbbR domain-containing protein
MLNRQSTPTIAERAESWLRQIFVADWGLKILALMITLVLWFFVSAHQGEREVTVEARIEGKPAPAFEVKEVTVTPGKIKVQGPADRVNAIERLTLPVSVEGRRESFETRGASLPMPDRSVEPLNTVNVHVTIVASGSETNKSSKIN